MSERLYLKSIDVLNLGPFEMAHWDIGPGGCIVSGENATGKSSLLNVIDWCGAGGSDIDLVHHGANGERVCESGEATLTFSDGSTFWKRQTLPVNPGEKGEVDQKARGPQGELKKQPATWLNERIPKKSFSISRYMEATREEQAAFLLEHIDISFTAEEVNALLETKVGALPNSEHVFPPVAGMITLTGFNEIYDTIYESRRQVNVQARDLNGVISDLQKSLPSGSDTDWAAERDRLQDAVTEIDKELASKVSSIKLEAEQARSAERKIADAGITEQKRFISEYIAGVEAFYGGVRSYAKCEMEECPVGAPTNFEGFINAVVAVRAFRADLDMFIKQADDAEAMAICEQTADLSAKRAALSLDLGTAKANADREQQSIGMRDAIEKRLTESRGLATKELRRSAILAAMEKAKHMRLKEIPIEGFDLKLDSRKRPIIMVNGTGIDKLSGRERIYLCVQCVQLGSGSMPLITLEGAELTSTYLDLLVEACRDAKPPIQLFATRPEKGKPLTVEALA